MSRRAQNFKEVFAPRPPRHHLPPSPPPPQLQALFIFSFTLRVLHNKATALFSLLIRLFSKTLRFLSSSMDSFSFSPDGDDDVFALDSSPPSPSVEPLFLVPLRWWSDANTAVNGGGEIKAVLYNVTASLSEKKLEKDSLFPEVQSEVVLDMRRADLTEASTCKDVSVSGDLHLALLSEWMFLTAFKWHNDINDTGGFLTQADLGKDFFSLQIRLSFFFQTNSLFIRINQKDNEVRAFDRACNIFNAKFGMLQIWDFSGQTSQIFMNDRKLFGDSDQPNEEMLLELQIYGLDEARETKREKMTMDQFKISAPPFSGSMMMNGSVDDVSFQKFKQFPQLDGINSSAFALGLTGLENLGNTCFMNSALQCLVHTSELVDYFLGDFRKDLNFENPLGMNGKLASAFGELLRKLWAPGAKPVHPGVFKFVIGGFAPQFSGYNQHDSQEFLAFLLDGLHEDLNRVKRKPYIEVNDGDGCPDEEVADEHWENHLIRNDSIIVDLCQGQYRSTLVCPVCKKKSVTFDPFMYLSLPLPSTTMRTVTLTIFSTDGMTLPFPVTVTVPKHGQLKDLLHALSMACSLRDDEALVVAQVYDARIVGFLDEQSGTIDLIRDEDRLVAYRLPKESEGSSLVMFLHEREDKSQVRAFFPSKRFGVPLMSRISDLSEGSDIRKEFINLLNPFLMPVEFSSNADNNKLNDTNGDAKLDSILGEYTDESTKSESDSSDFKFYLGGGRLSEKFDIKMDEPVPSSANLQVLVSWPEKMLEDYDTSRLSFLPQVCKRDLFSRKPREYISLYKCLDAFLKDEPLGPEDMWYCPSCKTHRQACKKLDLWRLPKILVIHLKRFSYNRYFKNKLETFVNFPIDDFDLSNYMAHNYGQVSHHYMLYAVTNHHGSMGTGHYTAYVQHGQSRWYEFDDRNVFSVSEEQIKTSSAYVLFYRKISDTEHNIMQ